ncbi:MAG: SIMPL domain-containing protein [Armatimonadota bacterium]|nr:SIMPL domain-containing protein [Armatimonadota bacterium]
MLKAVIAGLLALSLSMAPASAQAPEPARNQLITTGQGRAEVTPDAATVTVGAQAQRATASEAIGDVNRTAAGMLERLRALGVRPEEIRTSTVQVFPVHATPRDGAPPQTVGYRAISLMTVTLTNLALVGRVVDTAVAAGASTVQGISFGLRDPTRARIDALARAVRDAREKGEAIAQAAGLRIAGIERIVEEGVAVTPREIRVATGPAPTPVEPGLVTVTAQVTVTFRY